MKPRPHFPPPSISESLCILLGLTPRMVFTLAAGDLNTKTGDLQSRPHPNVQARRLAVPPRLHPTRVLDLVRQPPNRLDRGKHCLLACLNPLARERPIGRRVNPRKVERRRHISHVDIWYVATSNSFQTTCRTRVWIVPGWPVRGPALGRGRPRTAGAGGRSRPGGTSRTTWRPCSSSWPARSRERSLLPVIWGVEPHGATGDGVDEPGQRRVPREHFTRNRDPDGSRGILTGGMVTVRGRRCAPVDEPRLGAGAST